MNNSSEVENRFNVSSISDLRAVLSELVQKLVPGTTIALVGPLGAGKTTSTRILLELLGSLEAVSSPTFVLQHEYKLPSGLVIEHWDLYRLNQLPDELLEPAGANVIRLVEWADKFLEFMAQVDLVLRFELSEVLEDHSDSFNRFLTCHTSVQR